MSDEKLKASLIRASQHPDPCVREAENFAAVLHEGVKQFHAGNISAETLGHSWQKFFVDRLRTLFGDKEAELARLRSLNAELLDALDAVLAFPERECGCDDSADLGPQPCHFHRIESQVRAAVKMAEGR